MELTRDGGQLNLSKESRLALDWGLGVTSALRGGDTERGSFLPKVGVKAGAVGFKALFWLILVRCRPQLQELFFRSCGLSLWNWLAYEKIATFARRFLSILRCYERHNAKKYSHINDIDLLVYVCQNGICRFMDWIR
jgi:hypothetical protein